VVQQMCILYVYMYIHTHTHAHTHTHMSTYVTDDTPFVRKMSAAQQMHHMCTHTHTYVHTHIYTHTHENVCIRRRAGCEGDVGGAANAYTCVHIHTDTQTHTDTRMYVTDNAPLVRKILAAQQMHKYM